MENAIDALKMAFAVFIFVMALTVSIAMFSQLNEVSKIVISSTDITKFYTYEVADAEKSSRIVGLETIIPTLYKYYRENYTVLFLDQYGQPLDLYESQTNRKLWGSGPDSENVNKNAGIIAKYYTNDVNNYTGYRKNWDNMYDRKPVCSFDVDEETIRHEPWTGSMSDFNKNLDAFLYGGTFYYPSGATDNEGNRLAYKYKGFIDEYSDKKFKETLGEYSYNVTTLDNEEEESDNALLKNKKKRVIIYQLQQ